MDNIKKTLVTLPEQSGVYIYRDTHNVPIYVGKAINIKKRVRQYFDRTEKPIKTRELVKHIHTIETIPTISEFDAILLEAKLIQHYQPKYNSIAKDDRSPIYINIPLHTELPIIHLTRKPNIQIANQKDMYIGPFQSVSMAKRILATIRNIIPFCIQPIKKGKPCFYTHLGLCNPCPSIIVTHNIKQQTFLKKLYRSHIMMIRDILLGKSMKIRNILVKKMNAEAKNNVFEQAAQYRDQYIALEKILQTHFDPSVYTSHNSEVSVVIEQQLQELQQILRPYYPTLLNLSKIECIDISNTCGQNAVASLVTLINGHINTSLYKRFKIRTVAGQNDVAMIDEVIRRRFKHQEWEFPQLLVVDGGRAQLSRALSTLHELHIPIPVIGIAKRYDFILVKDNTILKELRLPMTNKGLQVIRRIRDESHRFAHAYHTNRRISSFIPKSLIGKT